MQSKRNNMQHNKHPWPKLFNQHLTRSLCIYLKRISHHLFRLQHNLNHILRWITFLGHLFFTQRSSNHSNVFSLSWILHIVGDLYKDAKKRRRRRRIFKRWTSGAVEDCKRQKVKLSRLLFMRKSLGQIIHRTSGEPTKHHCWNGIYCTHQIIRIQHIYVQSKFNVRLALLSLEYTC